MKERSIAIVVEGAMYVGDRRTERFSRLPIVIGRADDCDVVINRPTVAQRHARLVEVYGELFVMAETRRAIVRRPDGVRITGVTSLDAMGWAMQIGGVQVRVVNEAREGLVSEPPPASSTWRYSLERSPAGTEYWHGVAGGGALDVDDGDIEAVLARLHEPHEALLRAIAPLAGPPRGNDRDEPGRVFAAGAASARSSDGCALPAPEGDPGASRGARAVRRAAVLAIS